MNTLTHWNPFRSLARTGAGSGLDPLFRDFGLGPILGQFDVPDIRIEVSETDDAFLVKADVPGAKKEDIDVEVDGRQVSITARTSRSSESKDGNTLYTERSEGQVYRAFTLPTEVEDAGAGAKYEDGVLSLTLPKRAGGANRRVKIS
jgi:HSP20 family protein